ncbi:MAG TPA: alpha/beta hydrolase [Candidatus Dormibacteraeota bacterium]|nr:alpha/beta hydrolase [Candidatus Dormibacteraeota bacterium]
MAATEKANSQFRQEATVFMSSAGLPGRFGSNFDFQLATILGVSPYGGAAVGECYATISKVRDGDVRGWGDAWEETATRIEETASRCESEGHGISAAEAYLRASTYWRAAGFFHERTDKNRIAFWNRHRQSFRSGARLAGFLCEAIDIPFENGKTLPGYFVKASETMEPRATAIILGGGDTTPEEHYFTTGAAAVRRGYNALLIEIPGQRGAYYSDPELTFRPDIDVQFRYIVDYALSRADVKPEHLSLTGYSMGGLFAPRAMAGEKRIKAMVASCLTPSFLPGIMSLIGLDPDEPYADRTDLESLADQASPMARLLLGDIRERFGMLDRPVRDYLDYLKEFDLWGLEDKITCPVLNVGGEGEGAMVTDARRFYELLRGPKRARLIKETEGGEAHCAMNNRNLGNQIEFDFLDDVFSGTA